MGVDTSEHRSSDTTSMLNYAFANYKLNTILKKEKVIGEIAVKRGKSSKGTISVKEDITDLIKQNEEKTYSYKIDKYEVNAPVKKGDVVGKIDVLDNNGAIVKSTELVINEDIPKHTFFSLFASMFKNIIGGFN